MTSRDIGADLTADRLRALVGAPVAPLDVTDFAPNEHIRRLTHRVDIDRLREVAVAAVTERHDQGAGFHTRLVTRRPGVSEPERVDLSGRYWTRPDETGEEVARDPVVDEGAYTELDPEFAGTYLETVVDELRELAPIGRVRLLGKDPFNCNSWHRDPEPRLHIPIVTNPGALFVVGHHVTHLPADGSVYFTDTRAYHTALNGGETARLSLVAVIAAR